MTSHTPSKEGLTTLLYDRGLRELPPIPGVDEGSRPLGVRTDVTSKEQIFQYCHFNLMNQIPISNPDFFLGDNNLYHLQL